MAQKKAAKKQVKDWRYVNYTLSKSERDIALEWGRSEAVSLWQKCDEIVAGGYKITLSEDKMNKCVTASLTAKGEEHENYGMTLSGKGASTEDALIMVAYKHLVALEGNWEFDEEANYG